MSDAAIFLNNQDQAVRLPKHAEFPDHVKHVEVQVLGDSRVLSSIGGRWANWFETGSTVTDDFGLNREKPET